MYFKNSLLTGKFKIQVLLALKRKKSEASRIIKDSKKENVNLCRNLMSVTTASWDAYRPRFKHFTFVHWPT